MLMEKTPAVTISTNSHSLIHAQQFDYTLFIQMQLYDHLTLKKWLSDPSRVIDKKENLRILTQIIAGLQHVHKHGLLHRDLKPDNIFISKDGILKIGDFGLSRNLDSISPRAQEEPLQPLQKTGISQLSASCRFNGKDRSNPTSSVGTPGYVAPEVLSSSTYGPLVDVYSLGVILMELSVLQDH